MATNRSHAFLKHSDALSGHLFACLLRSRDEEPNLEPGTLIGPWRIKSSLGRGGAASVYLAERADRQFDQEVALKIIRCDERLVARFRRERQILADLRHPGIAGLIDGGETEDGRLWFAMEPVFGERIDDYAWSQRLPWRIRVQLVLGVCAAVGYAHGRQLIHRDIKPSNILVDPHGHARLLDFGIAVSIDGQDSHDLALTPGYASPEQRAGAIVTTASDVYQLGNLLRLLLEGDDMPSAATPVASSRSVRADLAAIIARATEYEPDRRYPAAAALAADLEALLDRRPVHARGTSPGYVATRYLQRHAAMVGVVGAALLGIAVLVAIDAVKVRRARDQAQQAALRAESSTNFLITLFSSPEIGKDYAARRVALDFLKQGETRLLNSFVYPPAQRAALAVDIARAYEGASDYAAASALLDKQLALAERDLPAESFERATLARWSGWMAFLAGDYALSAQRNDEASAGLRPSADPLREGERAALLGQRASLAKELGRLAEAERLRRQSLEIFARAYGPTNPRIVGQWLNLGAIELDLHHPDRAIGEFERALPIYQAAWGATHPWTIRAAFNLAEADIELRRYVDAEALLSPQLDNLRKQRPSAPDLLAWGLDLQGKTAFRQARYEQARNLADESIRILRQEQGGKSMTLASPLRNLARAELALGEPAAALAHDLEALDVSLSAFGERHGDVLDALLDLGTTRLHLSDLAGAKIDLDRAMKLGIDLGPDRAAGCATVQVVQAEMALLQNDHIAAARLLDLAEPVLASNRLGEVEWVERARALRARLKS